MLKRSVYLFMICLFLIMLVACGANNDTSSEDSTEGDNNETKITFSTGGTGGTYYPFGGGIAKVVNESDIGMDVTVATSGASVENARLLGSKEVELGLVEASVGYYAYEGKEMFEDDQAKNIRGIMSLYPNLIQMVVMKDSEIQSYADLKGKNVVVGAPGSSSMLNLELILEEYGLSMSDINPEYSSFSDGIDMLKDGKVDATLVDVGIPASSIVDISSQHDINILTLEEEKINSLSDKFPFFTKPIVIPAGTYKGVDEDVLTTGATVILATHEDLSEDVIYELTKTIFEKKEAITQIHKAGESIDVSKSTEGMSIPIHPGAKKYIEKNK